MLQDYFNWDTNLFLYFNNLGNNDWDWFWLIITEKKTWIPLYMLFFILLNLNFDWKKTLLIAICILLMLVCVDQTTNAIKNYFQRLRPCYNPNIQGLFRAIDCSGRGKYGFTSAHASNHISMAIFIGYILRKKYNWLIYLLIFWASLVAYSRVYLGVHYTGDIFFGMLLGIVFSYPFIKLYYYVLKKNAL